MFGQIIFLVLCIIGLCISALIVNKAQQLFMSFIGADTMFFNYKSKLVAIVIVALFITAPIAKLFGLV